MKEQEETSAPVVEETGLNLPKACAGCGTQDGVKRFAFRTIAASTHQRQLIPFCRECSAQIAATLILAWNIPTKE